MNPVRNARALLSPRPPPAPRAVAARRALDRLLLLAIAASLLAAVLERRARESLRATPIPSFPVDLAADPPERLRLLPGLGPTRVAALLSERERAGAPSTWTELERVRGIGEKTLATWRAAGATLGPAGPDPPPDAQRHAPAPEARDPRAPDPGAPHPGAPDPEAPASDASTSEARSPQAYVPAPRGAASGPLEGGAPPDPHAR